MRLKKVRKDRQCIRPEVCRTYNFGAKGSSKGLHYRKFLKPIKLSTSLIDWSKMDLSYLEQSRCNFSDIAKMALEVAELNKRACDSSLRLAFLLSQRIFAFSKNCESALRREWLTSINGKVLTS